MSILSAIAFVCTTIFCMFSITRASGSSYISKSSGHNSTTYLLMFTSSFFYYTANTTTLQYFLFELSHSCLSATFSTLTIYSLSLNSSAIYACKVLSVSEGSAAKSSYVAPSCSPSYMLGCRMLIGMTVMNLCWFPFGSMTALGVVDEVATCGAWLTNIFISVSYVSIVYLSTSCAVLIIVIGSNIVL